MLKLHENKILFPTLFSLLFIMILWFIPSPYTQLIFPNTERVPVEILSVDNTSIFQIGVVKQGEQKCVVRILSGRFKGLETTGVNLMMGSLEQDKIFVENDRVLAVIDYTDTEINYVNLVDHYRLDMEFWLVLAFVLLLVLFAGWTGLRSLISFVQTILVIWKLLIPAFLSGYNPLAVGFICTISLTVLIILLVYGFDRRSGAAIAGTIAGTLLTGVMAYFLVNQFKIHGAVMPYAESLMYAGYAHLDLTQIFMASIFIACSGAMMDVAVDITAAVSEVIQAAPHTTRKQAIMSGFSVGRAIMGTMTTTLLLAYSGGYISLLMVFMAQGTPLINILNLKYISSEILHTLIGSFGLVTVAPFTAITSGLLLVKHTKPIVSDDTQDIESL